MVVLGASKKRKLKKAEIRKHRKCVQHEIDQLKVDIFALRHGEDYVVDNDINIKEKETDIVLLVKEYFSFGFLEEDSREVDLFMDMLWI